MLDKGFHDFYIELYELIPCSSKEELIMREGQVIRQFATLNKVIPGRTPGEYYQLVKKPKRQEVMNFLRQHERTRAAALANAKKDYEKQQEET